MSAFSMTTSEEWVDPYQEALGYDDDKWDNFKEEVQAGLAKATTSKTAHIVQSILDGSYRNSTIGSSESSQEEGRIPTIFPQTAGEFLFMRNALEAAHKENNGRKEDFLQAIRNFIRRCQDYQKKGTLSSVQKAMISQWRNSDWARSSKYNPDTGKMEMSGPTKAEIRDKKITRFGTTTGVEGHQKMLLGVARRTGLLVGNEPHPHLGNMSSPHHEDHPSVWMEWAKHIARVLPKGLAPGPDRYPYPCHVRGFCRIAPLIREKKSKNDKSTGNFSVHRSGQYELIGLLASAGQYRRRLSALALSINTIPSWEPIEFLSQTTEDNCVRLLAMRGVTIDEADDCLHFAFTWLQSAMTIEDDAPRHIFLQGALQVVSQLPEVSHLSVT